MAEITGQIKGAYREEGFILDNSGNPVSLVDILNMILGGGADVNANNGLNVDGGFVQLGGPLIENTTVTNVGRTLKIGEDTPSNKAYIQQENAGRILVIHHENSTHLNYIAASATGFGVNVEDKANDINSQIDLNASEGAFAVANTNTGDFYSGVFIEETQIFVAGVRSYANTAAAQADSTLVVGGLYTITTDPTVLRIKHT